MFLSGSSTVHLSIHVLFGADSNVSELLFIHILELIT